MHSLSWLRTLKAAVVALLILPIFPLTAPAAENTATARRAALLSITADELGGHVDFLADDELEGRLPGTEGSRRAGDYLRDEFRKMGLKPAGRDGSYFQRFEPGYRNVLAQLVGRDEGLKGQVIIVGAHYDHVGYGSGSTSRGGIGQIHNGADDNASGTAAVLEVAEAFATLPQPPRRTILFALWDAEEQRFNGSLHFAAYPTVSIKDVALVVNLDMIGRLRDDQLHVFGTRSGYGLRRLISLQNTTRPMKLLFHWDLRQNSDHWTFFVRDLPVVMLHTGIHDDYHTPRDDAELVDDDGMRRVTRLLFKVMDELAERPELIRFRAAARHESDHARKRRFRAVASVPDRFGMTWQRQRSGGVMVTRVDHDGPAWRAGIAPGDRIVRVGHTTINTPGELEGAIVTARGPMDVVLRRRNEPEPRTVRVEPEGKPWRLGFTFLPDEAEPGTAVVNYVVPGTPAARAGLKVGDRIYRLDDQPFSDNDELLRLAAEADDPIPVLIEREGRLETIEVRVRDLPPVHGA